MLVPEHLAKLAEACAREALVRCGHDPAVDLPSGLIENISLRITQHNAEQLGIHHRDFRRMVDDPQSRLHEIERTSIDGFGS